MKAVILSLLSLTVLTSISKAQTDSQSLGYSRQVINGDIVHTATVTHSQETRARFMAEQAAVKAVVAECGFAHREIRIYSRKVTPMKFQYRAEAKAGISHEYCSQARGNQKNPSRVAALINQALVKDQEKYEEYLTEELKKDEKYLVVERRYEPYQPVAPMSDLEERAEEISDADDWPIPDSVRIRASLGDRILTEEQKNWDKGVLCALAFADSIDRVDAIAYIEKTPGVYKNGKRAEELWKEAISLKDSCGGKMGFSMHRKRPTPKGLED